MNENRLKPVLEYNRENHDVTYIMYNAFRLNNNHAIAHVLDIQKERMNRSIVLVYPLETTQRNRDFFNKGIANYKEVLSTVFNHVDLLDRDSKEFLESFKNTSKIVMDMPYLKEEKDFYKKVLSVCELNEIALELIETNLIVPVTYASNKEEYSARTIRKKIQLKIPYFLDTCIPIGQQFTYEEKALDVLETFVELKLDHYHLKNQPEHDYVSGLSPYLKYGFISPITIYIAVYESPSSNKDLFLEELVVRRELAYNFVYYNTAYYQFESITYAWAYTSMNDHIFDERTHLYDVDDYINYRTHDVYFNTAMKEMVELGKMHGYMRMYWCKKIIEWSRTYQEAYEISIYLNNHYFLDGNTPNGYTGVAWCFGKHDRAWAPRQIFGKLRYMNSNGLKRKFDIDSYVKRINLEVEECYE